MLQQVVTTLTQDQGILLGAILGTLGILGGTVIATAAVVSQAWRRARQTEDINALKHAMIERGMSANEIATVIRATPKRGFNFSFDPRHGHKCEHAAAC
ncbi:MAG: hypothetical protein KF708_23810 [Pirellulales bacterium]|nr:hypothetical protein [Pirellulales bacterium]